MPDSCPEWGLDATEIRPQPAWNEAGTGPAQPRPVRRAPLGIDHDPPRYVRSAPWEQEKFRSLTYVKGRSSFRCDKTNAGDRAAACAIIPRRGADVGSAIPAAVAASMG